MGAGVNKYGRIMYINNNNTFFFNNASPVDICYKIALSLHQYISHVDICYNITLSLHQ